MTDRPGDQSSPDPTHTVRLPRFLVPEPTGLGDAVKRITTAAGVRPCGGCEQRAARLNQWLQFGPRQ
jgi:hypothetical protein